MCLPSIYTFVSFLDSFVLHSLGFEHGSGSHPLGRLVRSLHETIPVTEANTKLEKGSVSHLVTHCIDRKLNIYWKLNPPVLCMIADTVQGKQNSTVLLKIYVSLHTLLDIIFKKECNFEYCGLNAYWS